jgi:hypothetical protein
MPRTSHSRPSIYCNLPRSRTATCLGLRGDISGPCGPTPTLRSSLPIRATRQLPQHQGIQTKFAALFCAPPIEDCPRTALKLWNGGLPSCSRSHPFRRRSSNGCGHRVRCLPDCTGSRISTWMMHPSLQEHCQHQLHAYLPPGPVSGYAAGAARGALSATREELHGIYRNLQVPPAW